MTDEMSQETIIANLKAAIEILEARINDLEQEVGDLNTDNRRLMGLEDE